MITPLPLPDTLAIPLPDDARLCVRAGMPVVGGQPLATSHQAGNIHAPCAGVAGAISKERLAIATPATAHCIHLARSDSQKTMTYPTTSSVSAQLKQSGIVGLGGSGFPTWKKWRPSLKLLIVNAVESDPLLHHDKALLDKHRDTVVDTINSVKTYLGVREAVLAVSDKRFARIPLTRLVPNHYAIGSEYLLTRAITDIPITRQQPLVDYGVLCLNIATVLAIADWIVRRTPLTGRTVTVHHDNDIGVLHVPFGARVQDIAAFCRYPAHSIVAGGSDVRSDIPAYAIICAQSNVVQFSTTTRTTQPASPCIQCGACDAACPVGLSPMILHRYMQDNRPDAAAAYRLADCITCKRCDDVCPSNIPLTTDFIHGKRTLAAQKTQRQRQDYLRHLHDAHRRRQNQQVCKRPSTDDIRRQVKDILGP